MSDSDKTTEPNTKLILEAINGLSIKIDGLEKKVDGLENKFDNLEKKVDGLENKFDNLEKKVDGLERKVDRLEKDFSEFRKITNVQFEAIRQGISANSAAFDRLEAKFHENRTDILNFRADMKDMHEDIRSWKKESTRETLELK